MKLTRLLRLVTVLIVAVFLAIAGLEPAQADPTNPSDPSRRPDVAPAVVATGDEIQPVKSVTDDLAAHMNTLTAAPLTEPAAGSGTVDLTRASTSRGDGLVRPGSLPVRVGPATAKAAQQLRLRPTRTPTAAIRPGKVAVRVLDAKAATAVGASGMLVQLVPEDGTTGSATSGQTTAQVAVQLDYSQLAAKGGDWASRAKVVQLPACAVTTPDKPRCRTQTPVSQVNDAQSRTVTALTSSASTMAVTASSSSPAGSYGATGLAPSGTWAAGGMSGDFSWG